MMTFEQVQNLLNNMGLIATIVRNGKDIATVKAVVINGQIITQYPIEIGDLIKIHNKSHKVLSVTTSLGLPESKDPHWPQIGQGILVQETMLPSLELHTSRTATAKQRRPS